MTTISCLLLKFWWNNMVSGDSVETQIISSQNNSTPINFFFFCFGKAKKKKKTIETNKKNFQLPVVTCRLLYQTEEDLSITTIYRYSNNSSFWSSTQSHEKKSYHYHYDNPCVIETILCFWATHLSHDHQHRKDCFFLFLFWVWFVISLLLCM